MELKRALEQAIEALEAGAELDWAADRGFHNDNKEAAATLREFMEKGLLFYEADKIEAVRQALCDACVLMQGWHSDGTDWSEWDEDVLKRSRAALGIVIDFQEASK